jgi:hypothetical protein
VRRIKKPPSHQDLRNLDGLVVKSDFAGCYAARC